MLRRIFAATAAALALSICFANADGPIYKRGDAVVTAFSGTKVIGDTRPVSTNANPIDQTFIDLDGIVAQIHDLSNLGSGPVGRINNGPVKFKVRARDVGQVFGVALDQSFDADRHELPSNIYLTATSAFGLQIVVPNDGGGFRRASVGEPGAQWMPGQFGTEKGGGPGSVWKVDGRTGEVTLFANITTNGQPNKAAGLGNITYDAASGTFFVSDMESGLIHHLSRSGQDLGTFDHGLAGRQKAGLPPVADNPTTRADITSPHFNVESPATWGYAPSERLVWGVAAEGKRLYYAVADGPAVWSVGLGPDGGFLDDVRREFDVKDTPNKNPISKLLVTNLTREIYLAQRGETTGSYDYSVFAQPVASVVRRYVRDANDKPWHEEGEEYAIGFEPDHVATTGGVALNYGYDEKGHIDYGKCYQTVWSTGEYLRKGASDLDLEGDEEVHGLQGEYKDQVRPQNVPPLATWFIDYQSNVRPSGVAGHIGDVAILNACVGGQPIIRATERVELPLLTVKKYCDIRAPGGLIPCNIEITNAGKVPLPPGDVTLVERTTILQGPDAGQVLAISDAERDGDDWICGEVPSDSFSCRLPSDRLPPGTTRIISVWIDTLDMVIDGNYGFHNCATVIGPRGRRAVDCVDAGFAEIIVTKSGPAFCEVGKPCVFTITVTNNGEQEYNGPLVIAETPSIGGKPVEGSIVSMTPLSGCVNVKSVPFTCTANMKLSPGEAKNIKIIMRSPMTTPHQLVNCVRIGDPALLAGDDSDIDYVALSEMMLRTKGAGYANCINVPVRVPVTVPPPPPVPPTYVPPSTFVETGHQCGSYWLPEGVACCPPGDWWNPDAGTCNRVPPRRHVQCNGYWVPEGTICCPRNQLWHTVSRSCRPIVVNLPSCPSNAIVGRGGRCVACANGYVPNGSHTQCVPVSCGSNQVRRADGACVAVNAPPLPPPANCGPGTRRALNGGCEPIRLACLEGQHLVGNKCVVNKVVCGVNQKPVGLTCVTIERLPTCDARHHLQGKVCVPNVANVPAVAHNTYVPKRTKPTSGKTTAKSGSGSNGGNGGRTGHGHGGNTSHHASGNAHRATPTRHTAAVHKAAPKPHNNINPRRKKSS